MHDGGGHGLEGPALVQQTVQAVLRNVDPHESLGRRHFEHPGGDRHAIAVGEPGVEGQNLVGGAGLAHREVDVQRVVDGQWPMHCHRRRPDDRARPGQGRAGQRGEKG